MYVRKYIHTAQIIGHTKELVSFHTIISNFELPVVIPSIILLIASNSFYMYIR